MKFSSVLMLIIAGLLLWLGCNSDNPTEPSIDYESELNVFGMLILNRQQKTIRIERTYKVTENFPGFRGVADAEVWVRTKNQNVKFAHLFNGNYSDIENALKLVVGETYMLDVTMPDGHKVTSECVMPAPPIILSPNNDEAVSAFQPLNVFWERGDFAYRYEIAVDDEFRNFRFNAFSDSTHAQLFPFIFANNGRYNLKIASLDKNYWDHLRSSSRREPLLNIKGALGVFGAIAYDKSVFYAY